MDNDNNNNLNQDILDKLTKTCTCKLITRAKIKEAIRNGASTVKEVQEATGAGSGACNGKNCSPRIYQLIKDHNNN